MDIIKKLDGLEDKYSTDELEDKRDELIAELNQIHLEVGEDEDSLNRFIVQVGERFGGIYIPFIFWDKLSEFLNVPEERAYLYQIIKTFSNSDFYEEEQKKMKPLLITYFAKEKQFEIDKLCTLVFDKAHPTVKEYYYKLLSFVEKNSKSTNMYKEKFELLRDVHPNFSLMNLPITQLRDKLAQA